MYHGYTCHIASINRYRAPGVSDHRSSSMMLSMYAQLVMFMMSWCICSMISYPCDSSHMYAQLVMFLMSWCICSMISYPCDSSHMCGITGHISDVMMYVQHDQLSMWFISHVWYNWSYFWCHDVCAAWPVIYVIHLICVV